jgi:hypothetical protein
MYASCRHRTVEGGRDACIQRMVPRVPRSKAGRTPQYGLAPRRPRYRSKRERSRRVRHSGSIRYRLSVHVEASKLRALCHGPRQ